MHTSSHEKMAAFVTTYLMDYRGTQLEILDVEAGLNVDVVPAA